jgi:hypothetical protein
MQLLLIKSKLPTATVGPALYIPQHSPTCFVYKARQEPHQIIDSIANASVKQPICTLPPADPASAPAPARAHLRVHGLDLTNPDSCAHMYAYTSPLSPTRGKKTTPLSMIPSPCESRPHPPTHPPPTPPPPTPARAHLRVHCLDLPLHPICTDQGANEELRKPAGARHRHNNM